MTLSVKTYHIPNPRLGVLVGDSDRYTETQVWLERERWLEPITARIGAEGPRDSTLRRGIDVLRPAEVGAVIVLAGEPGDIEVPARTCQQELGAYAAVPVLLPECVLCDVLGERPYLRVVDLVLPDICDPAPLVRELSDLNVDVRVLHGPTPEAAVAAAKERARVANSAGEAGITVLWDLRQEAAVTASAIRTWTGWPTTTITSLLLHRGSRVLQEM